MPLYSEDDSGLPFVLRRNQFPVWVSFALTINKSQRQTIRNVGFFKGFFLYKYIYISLHRPRTGKLLAQDGKLAKWRGAFTKNRNIQGGFNYPSNANHSRFFHIFVSFSYNNKSIFKSIFYVIFDVGFDDNDVLLNKLSSIEGRFWSISFSKRNIVRILREVVGLLHEQVNGR